MVEKLNRNRMVELLEAHAAQSLQTYRDGRGSSPNWFLRLLPDPVMARWLVVECMDPMTNEELVNRALAMSSRPMADVPISVVPENHPLRKLA